MDKYRDRLELISKIKQLRAGAIKNALFGLKFNILKHIMYPPTQH